MSYSKEFLQYTIKVWQPYSAEKLTEEDAREIADNMGGLYRLIVELEQKYGKDDPKIDAQTVPKQSENLAKRKKKQQSV